MFVAPILFTDEAHFTPDGKVSLRSVYAWTENNPQITRVARYLDQCLINV
jgi:hypothetical protein